MTDGQASVGDGKVMLRLDMMLFVLEAAVVGLDVRS